MNRLTRLEKESSAPARAGGKKVLTLIAVFILLINLQAITAFASSWTQKQPSNSPWYDAVAYGNNTFIAIDYNGGVYKSTDNGQTWELKTTLSSNIGYVTFGNGKFIATDNNNEYIFFSSDNGNTWSNLQIGITGSSLTGITYGSSGFVTVGCWSSSKASIFTSSDGTTGWTERFFDIDPDGISGMAFNNVGYGNGTYVVVGSNGRIYTSTNATDWTLRTTPNTEGYMGVAFGNNTFVAVGSSGSIITSSDNGVTWSASVVYKATHCLNGVTYYNGCFYAVESSGIVVKSSDGIHWAEEASGVTTDLYDIKGGNDCLVAVGTDFSSSGVILGRAATFSITYDGNGSTGGSNPVDGTSYTNGSTATVLGNTNGLIKNGYSFAGWNTAANGSGTNYIAGGTFSIGADTTLYAQWEISAASVTMATPAAGATPQSAAAVEAATANSNYTVSNVVWNEDLTAGGKFKANQAYTATVTLTSNIGTKFQSAAFTPTVAGSSSVGTTTTTGSGTGNTVSFTVTFPSTSALSVSTISVKTQPTTHSYIEGDALSLSGLVATLTYNDGTAADVAYANFGANGITANPDAGTIMSVAANNGQPVTLTCNTHTATTSNLTVSAPMSAASVTITAPAAGATPQSAAAVEAATSNSNYTVSNVVWNEALTAGGKFKANKAYTATVTLTSNIGTKFQSAAFTPTVAGSSSVGTTTTTGSGTGNTVSFTVTFPSTSALSVSTISVKTQPTTHTYIEGDALSLSGLVATLTYNDGTAADVAYANFGANGITASPDAGTIMTVAANNGHPVTLTCNSKTAVTNALSVSVPSSDAGLSSVLGQAITPGAEAGTSGAPKTASLNVANTVSTAAAANIVKHDSGATVTFYGTDNTFTNPAAGSVNLTAGSGTDVYIKVTAADTSTLYYKVTINRAAQPPAPAPVPAPAPAPDSGVKVLVDGQTETAATSTTTQEGNRTVTTVTVDDKKVDEKLQTAGNNATVTIPVNNKSDVVVGQLSGQTVKNMEAKDAVLEIKTDNVTYTLPASQINIENVSTQIGQQVALSDIKVNVTISAPPQDTVKIVENTAQKNNYQVVVKPVDFEISCTSGNKTVEVSKFNGYVERTVAIPDGIDPSKITTGIVLNADGTFSHVPTSIIVIGGKYYAKINSLTNSTYSVIYNSRTFKDVENHWAKDAVNDMGSRLIIDGTGNDMFEPDKDITRGEFAAIVVRALGLMRPGTGKAYFSDVSKDNGYYDAISIAYEYGIISGYGNGKFGPANKITREQAMTIITRAMKIAGLKMDITNSEINSLLANCADGTAASDYAKTSIAVCLKTGLVTVETDRKVAPKSNVTRAQVAVIVQRLLKKSDLI